jgi:sec-independent protein translocase protein TatC
VKEKKYSDHDAAVDDNEQPFLDHLIELRARILRSLGLVAVLFIPIYYNSAFLFEWIAAPLISVMPEGSQLIATQVASPFLVPFKLSIYCALFVGIPFLLHQLWGFVSPGLYRHEKKFAYPLLFSSIVLFYCGIAFSYYLVFPLVFEFFYNVAPDVAAVTPDISYYLDFIMKMFFAFGLAFEIPVATFLMAWTGISSADRMASKRPYVIIGCFVVGMLMTPPDVVSQLLLAIPTWFLFEFGVILARFVERKTDHEPSDTIP